MAVETDRPNGVSSTTLRSVPIREVVAEGLRTAIRRVHVSPDGSAKVREIGKADEEEVAGVVARLVGYIEVRELRGGEVNISIKPTKRRRS